MGATSSSVTPTDSSIAARRYARIALLVVLALLAWSAFRDEYGTVPILGDVDTAIHEFGHMLFMPFGIPLLGHTMVILGGSLFQVVFPLIFLGYFLHNREEQPRDVHAAMVCLWWAAMNVLGVAIYCADARAGQLMLVSGQTGQESDGHDWNNLLTQWHLLNKDTRIAGQMRSVAWLMFAISIGVGLRAAWRSGKKTVGGPKAIE